MNPTVPSARARRWMPLVLLAVIAGGCDSRQQVDTRAQALREVVDGRGVGPAMGDDPVPSAREAQALWIARRAIARMKFLTDSVSAKYGIDINQPPAAFTQQEYYATAARHPEVRQYFAGYAQYAADVRVNAFPWLRQKMREDAARTRLGDDFERGLARGFDRKVPDFQRSMETAEASAKEIVALHDYLVSIGPRVHWRNGSVVFDRNDELDRASEMDRHARAGFQEAAEFAQRSEQQGREDLQQLTTEMTRN